MGARRWLQQWEVTHLHQKSSPTPPAQGPRQPGTDPFSSPMFLHAVSAIQQQPLGAIYEVPTTDPKK